MIMHTQHPSNDLTPSPVGQFGQVNMTIGSTLDYNASVLMERGKNTRGACTAGKVLGMLAIPAAILGLVTGNYKVAVPAALVSTAVYGAAITKEVSTVGRLMPFPFCDWDIGMIARAGGMAGETAPTLTGLDYLDLPERSRFALSTTLKPLTAQLERLEYTEQAVSYELLCNGMVRLYPHLLKDISVLPSYVGQLNGGIGGINMSLTEALQPQHRKAFNSGELPVLLTPAQDAMADPVDEEDEWEEEEYPGQWEEEEEEEETDVLDVPVKTVSDPARVPQSRGRVPARAPKPAPKAVRMPATEPVAAKSKRTTRVTRAKNAIEEIAMSPFKPRIFLGNQRTGKTCTAALASLQANQKFNTTIFRVNLASIGDEDGKYWRHVEEENKIHCDITAMEFSQANQVINQVIDLINKFSETSNAIFIIDEISLIGNQHFIFSAPIKPVLKRLANHISTFSSIGLKQSRSVWYIGREFIAGTLTDDMKAAKNMGLVMTSIAPDHTDYWTHPITGIEQALTYDDGLYKSTKYNFPITEPPEFNKTSRITFVNNHWVAPGIDGTEFD